MKVKNNSSNFMYRNVGVFLCTTLGLFLTVAIASFNINDPGWSTSGSGDPVRNLCGTLGAWWADVLLSLFGYVAFSFPALVLWFSLNVYRQTLVSDYFPRWLQVVGWTIGLLSLSAFASYTPNSFEWTPQGAGGLVGFGLQRALEKLFVPMAAGAISIALVALALPLTFDYFARLLPLTWRRAIQKWRESLAEINAARRTQAGSQAANTNNTACTNCGHSISIMAPMCPSCGHPNKLTRSTSNAGSTSGLLGILFALLGFFTYGLLFLPLAVVCSAISFFRSILGNSASGFAMAILSSLLTAIGFSASPSTWPFLLAFFGN